MKTKTKTKRNETKTKMKIKPSNNTFDLVNALSQFSSQLQEEGFIGSIVSVKEATHRGLIK
jgi:hypothetical protein